METSVIDLLVPTDIQVDDIDNNTSKYIIILGFLFVVSIIL